jgi:hypothetical protein
MQHRAFPEDHEEKIKELQKNKLEIEIQRNRKYRNRDVFLLHPKFSKLYIIVL